MSDMKQAKSHKKLITIIVLIFLIIPAIVFYFGMVRPQQQLAKNIKIDGVFLAKPQNVNDFQLTDNHGKPFTKENLKGHWTMMFFGFTNCDFVCPTSMSELNKMYKVLETELPGEKLPQVLFVSVDPERDTVARLNSYVTAFNPHFMGARAEIDDTEALEKQFYVVAAKMQVEGQSKDHYTINHSSEVILFNPEGKLQAFLSYPHKADQMVIDYKAILETVRS